LGFRFASYPFHLGKDPSMPSDVWRMLGLVLMVGVLASVLGGGILPLLVTAAVVWAGYHVAHRLFG